MNHDNLPRWDGQTKGVVESWYLTLQDPKSLAAWWIRHVLHSPQDGPAFAVLQAVEFAPGRPPVACREIVPAGEFSADPFSFRLRVGSASIEEGRAAGRIHAAPRASWDLAWKPAGATYHHAPPLVRTFSRFFLALPSPRTRFSGTVSVAGRSVSLDGAPGCQGHFASSSLGPGWIWAHATEFEEGPGFAEALAPARGFPASIGVAWRGRAWAGNALGGILAGRCEGADWKRVFRTETPEGPVTWEITGDPREAVGLEYDGGSSARLYAYNTLVASSTLTLGDRTLRSRGTTILEIAQQLPRLDLPLSLRAPSPPAPRASAH